MMDSSQQETPMRFAVLHHTGVEDPHYDFMFETSPTSQLVTFRLPRWPLFENVSAIKLRDHRRAYLDFQGDISIGRGHVQRVDEGDCTPTQTSQGWVVQLNARTRLEFEPENAGVEENWWVRVHREPTC
jgi:hypothetical protein